MAQQPQCGFDFTELREGHSRLSLSSCEEIVVGRSFGSRQFLQ